MKHADISKANARRLGYRKGKDIGPLVGKIRERIEAVNIVLLHETDPSARERLQRDIRHLEEDAAELMRLHDEAQQPAARCGKKVLASTAPAGRASGERRRQDARDRNDDIVRRAERFTHMTVSEAVYYVHQSFEDEAPDPDDPIPCKSTIYRAIRHLWHTTKKPLRQRRS